MELVLLIVGFIVFVAERLALCLMLYMLLTWTLSIIEEPLRRLHRWMLLKVSGLRWVREAVQFWSALRLVRRQLI
jgi:hypothetical protein